jgi:8-oxo-dGTP diphosphatase
MNKMKYPRIGVALIFINKNYEILLLQRAKNNTFGLVGGKIDYGETFVEAAIREAKEEINLTPTKLEYLGLNEAISKDKEEHHVTAFYLVYEYTGKLKNNEPDKHLNLNYFDIENLPNNLFFPFEKALPTLKEMFK